MQTTVQPITQLRESLAKAFQGVKQKAFAADDTGLKVAVEEAEVAVANGQPIPPSSYAELENLRSIYDQQLAVRTKAAQTNMKDILMRSRKDIATIKSQVQKDKANGASYSIDAFENYIEQDLKRLAEGDLPWQPGDAWFDLLKAGHYWGGAIPKKTDTGLILTSSSTDNGPSLTSLFVNRLPLELEATVKVDGAVCFISFGVDKFIFNDPTYPDGIKLIYPTGPGFDSKQLPSKPLPKTGICRFNIRLHERGYSISVNGEDICTSTTPLFSKLGTVAIGSLNDSTIEVQHARFRTPGQARYLKPETLSNESAQQLAAVTVARKRIPIASLGTDLPTPDPKANTSKPAADKRFPTSVALFDAPEVVEVTEDPDRRIFIYKSPNYQFVCDSKLSVNVVREFGRIFEATYLLNCRLPLDIQPEPEVFKTAFTARIITSDESYQRQGGAVGSAGVYIPSAKSILVPLSSLGVKLEKNKVYMDYDNQDHHTLIHEITHQMMNRWLDKLPIWLAEGSAEFIAWTSYKQGKFTLTDMHKNIPEKLGRRGLNVAGATIPQLSTLMGYDHAKWGASVQAGSASANYAGAALLTYYFYLLDDKKDGANIAACFKAIKAGTPHEEAIKTHLLRGRTYPQMQRDMAVAFESLGVYLNFKDAAP